MRHALLAVMAVFLVGHNLSYFSRRGNAAGPVPGSVAVPEPTLTIPQDAQARAADLAAIERLHNEDIEVTLSQDPKGLLDIWAEDGVRLLPGGPAEVGKKAIEAGNQKGRGEHPGFRVLSYTPEFKELQIVNGWAFEWGTFDATYKLSAESPAVTLHNKFLRVMRRQSDSSWKFARVIVN